MAPKRAAGTTQGRAAKASKVARAEPETVADPFLAECTEVLSALDDSALPEGDRELLKAAAPDSLRTARAERHKFQQGMVELLGKAFTDMETAKRESIAALEARAQEIAAKRSNFSEEQAAAEAAVADKEAANAAQGQALKEAADAAAAAAASAEAERTKSQELQAAREACAARTAEMERVLAEMWHPLKAISFPGKDWRQRDKVIGALMHSLGEGIDASLQKALPIALKMKSGSERGPFAQMAVEAGEAALNAKMDKLREELVAAEAAKAEQGEAVKAAEAVKTTADEAASAAMEVSIAADNAKLDASEALRELLEGLPKLDAQELEVAKAHEAAKEELAKLLEAAARFGRLEGGLPAAESSEAAA